MKNAKRTLLCLCCVALIVAASVMGTIAYLTDKDSVTNTFSIGDVDIILDEEAVTPEGKPTDDPTDPRVKQNNYHLIPGQSYVKDPTVTVVKGSESSFVRMFVSINCYDELQKIYSGTFLPQYFVEGWDNTVWVSTEKVEVSADGKVATYEFRYKEAVKPADENTDLVLPALFTSFKVPETFTNENLKALKDLTITAEAHAIQSAGFADVTDPATGAVTTTAQEAAWAAFDVQNP